MEIARQLAAKEGLLVGISTGAAVAAALQIAKDLGAGKRILVIALIPVGVIYQQNCSDRISRLLRLSMSGRRPEKRSWRQLRKIDPLDLYMV